MALIMSRLNTIRDKSRIDEWVLSDELFHNLVVAAALKAVATTFYV